MECRDGLLDRLGFAGNLQIGVILDCGNDTIPEAVNLGLRYETASFSTEVNGLLLDGDTVAADTTCNPTFLVTFDCLIYHSSPQR
jgi:hypothetical protein